MNPPPVGARPKLTFLTMQLGFGRPGRRAPVRLPSLATVSLSEERDAQQRFELAVARELAGDCC